MDNNMTNQEEKLIEPGKARKILFAAIFIYVVIGVVIGYTFVWDQYSTNSRYEQEITDTQKKVKEKPNDIKPRLDLGYSYMKAQKYVEARKEYEAALRIDPNDITARINMANLDIETKRFQDADNILADVLKTEPQFQVYFLLGKSNFLEQKYTQAIQNYMAARDLNPTDTEVLYQLGLSYEKTGNKEMAIASFRDALQYDPNRPDVREALKRISK